MERGPLLGGIIVAAGAVLLLVSALADPLGFGNGGFGWKQTAGIVVGAVAAVVGLALIYLRRGQMKAVQPPT